MGRRLQLHPVVVFVGVLAGGLVAGTIGVLMAAPIVGTLRVLLRYVHAKLLNEDPFPTEMVQPGEIYPGEIDAVLFDLDGTLVETDDDAVEQLTRRLRRLRWMLPGRDPDRTARRILVAAESPANSMLTLLDRVGLDDNVLDLGERLFRMRGLSTPLNFRPVEGVIEALHDLGRRYHLAIVTTRSRLHAESFLKQAGLAELVTVIVSREDTWRIKPHPDPILHAAKALDVPVERCLMVGDTTVDVLAARAAGARSVGVLSGFGVEKDLDRAGADMIVDSAAKLQRWM
jgi:phosphoglycolate phosphatase-like HAD superfamily hydrolase